MPERPFLVVITGMSGAGRSLTAKALEDIGFFVIDNLPAGLISEVVAHADLPESPRRRLAVVVDTRGGLSFAELESVLMTLAGNEVQTRLVFLDADDEVLVKRFEESRRPHPVEGATLADSIAVERTALEDLRGKADILIDTTNKTVHELRTAVESVFATDQPRRPLLVSVTSFGFKHGLPRVIDLLFDVRFLPNPHWVAELRPLTGLDDPVREYVFSQDDAQTFLDRTTVLLEFLLPRYEAEGKSYLTIGIGCTGGRHRSVAIAEALGEWIAGHDMAVTVLHRDAER